MTEYVILINSKVAGQLITFLSLLLAFYAFALYKYIKNGVDKNMKEHIKDYIKEKRK